MIAVDSLIEEVTVVGEDAVKSDLAADSVFFNVVCRFVLLLNSVEVDWFRQVRPFGCRRAAHTLLIKKRILKAESVIT